MSSYDEHLKQQQEAERRAQAERDKWAAAAQDQASKNLSAPAPSQHHGQQQF